MYLEVSGLEGPMSRVKEVGTELFRGSYSTSYKPNTVLALLRTHHSTFTHVVLYLLHSSDYIPDFGYLPTLYL